MFVRTGVSLGRWLTRRLVLPLIVLTPVRCNSDATARSLARDTVPSGQQQPTTENAVLHWHAVATELMVDPGPVIDSRAYAILMAAIHDAVNGVTRRFEPYTADLSSPGASVDAAVATAARDVLVTLSPSQRDKIEEAYAAALAAIPVGAARDQGVALGRRSAQVNLDRRANDNIPVGPWPPLSGPITEPVYVPTGTPGDYAFTPPFDRPPLGPIALFPGWGRLTPFAVDLTKYRLPGPDALASEAYARDVNHLKSIGSRQSRIRTADQTEAAFFWFEGSVIWNQIANRVLKKKHVDEWQAARTLALMQLAMTDAGIACFEAKYRFRFWRPFTAIRRADEDNNPRTEADKAWLPLLWTPPETAHPIFLIPPIPEYPSAAATISSAGAAVLIDHLGDRQTFEATSPFLAGVTRRFSSLAGAAEEAGMSRVYGGIHFLRAVRDGAQLGKSVGNDVSRLLPEVRR